MDGLTNNSSKSSPSTRLSVETEFPATQQKKQINFAPFAEMDLVREGKDKEPLNDANVGPKEYNYHYDDHIDDEDDIIPGVVYKDTVHFRNPPNEMQQTNRLGDVCRKSTGPFDLFRNTREAVDTMGTPWCWVFCMCLMAIYPMIMIGVGSAHTNQCPVSTNIPTFLIVGGVLLLLRISMTIYEELLNVGRPGAGTRTKESIVWRAADAILGIAILGWFICGCVFVFTVYPYVQFEENIHDPRNYCNGDFYMFAFATVIIHILFIGVILLSSFVLFTCTKSRRFSAVTLE